MARLHLRCTQHTRVLWAALTSGCVKCVLGLQNSCLDAAAAAGPEFVFVQTRDAVEFCQAVMAGTAARRSEEGRGRGGISPAPSGGRPASPHVRRTVSAVADGPLAPVAERDVSNLDLHPAAVTSPFERQSRVSWEK